MSEQLNGVIKYIAAMLLLAAVVTFAVYLTMRMQVNTADLAFDAPAKKHSKAETEQVDAMRSALRKADAKHRGGISESEGFGASAPAVNPEQPDFSE